MDIDQIKKDCQRRMNQAMQKTRNDSEQIIDKSFDVFYSQGSPRRPRTHTLPGARYIGPVELSGDTAYLEVGYEGNQISYSDGTFSGGEVLGATMTKTYGVLGNPAYDDQAFEEILETADKNFASEFS